VTVIPGLSENMTEKSWKQSVGKLKKKNKYLSSVGKTKRKELCRLIRFEKEGRIEKTVFLLLRSFRSGMLNAIWCDTQTFSNDAVNSVCMWVLWQVCVRDTFNTLPVYRARFTSVWSWYLICWFLKLLKTANWIVVTLYHPQLFRRHDFRWSGGSSYSGTSAKNRGFSRTQ